MQDTTTPRGIVAGIMQERADQAAAPRYTPRTDKKPSGKQIYSICHLLCDVAGLQWPQTSADASQLIGHLREQVAAVQTADAIPF